MASSDHIIVELAGHEVKISSPDKVFVTKRGETKLDLVRYYEAVAAPLMNTMGGRPTLMQRFPDGASGKSFFQKRVPKGAPDWLETAVVSTPNGTTSDAMVAADIGHIAWAVNLGCLGFHPWPYLASDPDHTDELRIDLDPSPGVGFDGIRAGALEVKKLLDELGITSYVKTSGSKGLHIYVRLVKEWDSYEPLPSPRSPTGTVGATWTARRKEERGQILSVRRLQPERPTRPCSAPGRCGRLRRSRPRSAWDEVETVQPDEPHDRYGAQAARVAGRCLGRHQ
ncbi:MAG: hypothetical protein R2710_10120 [Acidimicrobiales bacterium]